MRSERTWITLRTLAIISAVAVLPTILLFVVNSQAGLAMLAGIGLAWLVYFIVYLRREHPGIALALIFVLVLIGVLALIVALSSFMMLGVGGGGGEDLLACPTELVVTDAAFVIDGSTLSSGTLVISGEVNGSKRVEYNDDSPPSDCAPEGEVPLPTQEIPEQALAVTERGFTLSETTFATARLLERSFRDFDTVRTFGAAITIELRNFPRGSFYQARGVNTVESSTYLDTETVKWSPPEDEVTFSFIRPGYGFTRPVVDLMYGAQSLDTLVVGAVGSLGTLILGTVVEVVVGRFVKKPLEKLLDKKDEKKKT